MSARIGIIGGSGLRALKNLEIVRRQVVRTPYGEPSAPLVFGTVGGQDVVFLPRHGAGHTIPPHEVNYQANIWALGEAAGVHAIVAVAAVGAITGLEPGGLMVPDQIIDYTYGRKHTFFGGGDKSVTHVDFTRPYCDRLRRVLLKAAAAAKIDCVDGGTYAATQGPRFETAAEIRRLEQDGADIVGMTGMPEASLAREMDVCYAALAVSANPAAGKVEGEITLPEVERNIEKGMKKVRTLLEQAMPLWAVAE